MATYRITYSDFDVSRLENAIVRFPEGQPMVPQGNRPMILPGKIEIRSSDGDLFRLRAGSEFHIENTLEGLQPVISGEVFAINAASWWKSTRSCHTCKSHSSPPLQILMRPHNSNTDEYLLAMGSTVIHDFDTSGRHFVICSLEEGHKAYVSHNPDVPMGPSRYSVQIDRMSDSDWDYVHQEYLDNRLWM